MILSPPFPSDRKRIITQILPSANSVYLTNPMRSKLPSC
jgi:hypothetical protein